MSHSGPGYLSSSESDEGLDKSFSTTCMTEKSKIFSDAVHGTHLKLPSICSRIINTPQFQRLRNLKQVGLCYHVYPSASHNRFEHCIGTSFLAGKYCRILKRNQPSLGINEKDVLCVYIAGLCHDLGHGPFSHAWEHFMKRYKEDYSHEIMSIRMFDFMIEDNVLEEWFVEDNLGEIDRIFIKELILGHPLPGNDSFKGRGPEKNFLYQIVSNDETKIDVDKFDYLLRDCKQLNLTTTFDHQRIFDNSRVFMVKDSENGPDISKIAYRKKITDTLQDLFEGRFRMHQIAYQHRVTKIIEEMILDGLHAADTEFEVLGKNNEVYRLSTAHEDMSAFMKLTDSIFDIILMWTTGCARTKQLYQNILNRKLYNSLGYVVNLPVGDVLKEFQKINENLGMIKRSINFGQGSINPLNQALFFEKSRPDRSFKRNFSPPKEERSYLIVLKMVSEEFPDKSSLISPDVDLLQMKKQLKEWATRHEIQIHFE